MMGPGQGRIRIFRTETFAYFPGAHIGLRKGLNISIPTCLLTATWIARIAAGRSSNRRKCSMPSGTCLLMQPMSGASGSIGGMHPHLPGSPSSVSTRWMRQPMGTGYSQTDSLSSGIEPVAESRGGAIPGSYRRCPVPGRALSTVFGPEPACLRPCPFHP